jgi:hypothetical protein
MNHSDILGVQNAQGAPIVENTFVIHIPQPVERKSAEAAQHKPAGDDDHVPARS